MDLLPILLWEYHSQYVRLIILCMIWNESLDVGNATELFISAFHVQVSLKHFIWHILWSYVNTFTAVFPLLDISWKCWLEIYW